MGLIIHSVGNDLRDDFVKTIAEGDRVEVIEG